MRTLGFLLLIALGVFFGWLILLNQSIVPVHLDPFNLGIMEPNPRPMRVWGVMAWFLFAGALLGYCYGAINRASRKSYEKKPDDKPKTEEPAGEAAKDDDTASEVSYLMGVYKVGSR